MLSYTLFVAATALLSLASAAPTPTVNETMIDRSLIQKRGFNCDSPVSGLNKADYEYMASIGILGQGVNAMSDSGRIWIGEGGPNTFTFKNDADGPLIVVLWDFPPSDYEASFMNARHAAVSSSLPRKGDRVVVSLANGVSGGWSALVNQNTKLSQYGQIDNTWGEFTTGNYATVDISREVNMRGTSMSVRTSGGCVSDMNRCVFVCKSGDKCGESGSYTLQDCQPGSQPGANYWTDNVNASGGCQAWSNGGHLEITLGN
ncbi:hypothetical protein QQS21_000744 [Conoideocrella luteorostrata]|uniref:Effector 5 n=1 Tax=Conoideocrella luteorostrata TaxID=1105319 RepID=A0AAJ0FYY7_9HYPO|nr:hypothetical protein QQS21_000744 [Conoideocrella luteorostrata]